MYDILNYEFKLYDFRIKECEIRNNIHFDTLLVHFRSYLYSAIAIL